MSKRAIFVLLLVPVLTVPAAAQFVESLEVSQIDNIAVNSNFTAATGQLAWSQGSIATLYCDGGTQKYRVTVNALWDDLTDLSAGGWAAASFASGSFSIDFFAMTDPGKTTRLGGLSGELYPGWAYDEEEQAENPTRLYGAAPVRLTAWDLPGFEWAEDIGDMGGLTATTTNLFGTLGNISDYQSDWWSRNTVVTVLADESGIPEPATIALLGLGAAGLVARRRSS